jgi:hypothetical protein
LKECKYCNVPEILVEFNEVDWIADRNSKSRPSYDDISARSDTLRDKTPNGLCPVIAELLIID